ncbi:MAG TPA: DMT family transporter [Pseudorhodoplanes sp.]|jgi:drug/metabolite transporter (DMT)-like permease|nr:DMT family transporter [Pseudorhodoplanes sp.]
MISPRSSAAKAPRAILAGIALMLFGCLLSAGMSTLAKAMMFAFPLMQVLLVRNLTAAAVCAPFAIGPLLNMPRPWLQLFRFALCAAEAPMYLYAISQLPLVDVMTFYMAGPIYVTVLSATLLGETVRWRRWSAVLVGFLGVLIALRPSSAMLTASALIALTGSVLYAGVLTTTRMLRGTPNVVLMMTQISGPLVYALIAGLQNWTEPSLTDLVLMCSLGLGSVVTTGCISRSLALAPASIVVPYQYALIVGGALFGYLFFGERPDVTTLIGAAIIIGAGVYIFTRELKVAPRPPVVEAP